MESNILLTIGIPTFNRAGILDLTLADIISQTRNRGDIEIIVSDNHSTDNTEEVVRKYMKVYSNIVYIKQPANLGFDRNLKTIFDTAKGEFIKGHGDDDFLLPGKINQILSIVTTSPNSDLFFCTFHKGSSHTRNGMDELLRNLRNSNGATFFTAMIIRKSAYNKIVYKDRFLSSHIYQLYIEMELLKTNPTFTIICGGIVSRRSGLEARRFYNVGEVFIQNYFDILAEYVEKGLSTLCFNEEKDHVFKTSLIPILKVMRGGGTSLTNDNLLDIFTRYYYDDPGFAAKYQLIASFS